MRKYLLLFSMLFVLLVLDGQKATAQSNSPDVVNIAGGSVKIGYYDFDWNVGELCLVETFTGGTTTLTQGFLQPCTQKVTIQPLLLLFTTNEYRVFPNPTSGQFELDFMLCTTGVMKLQLLDEAGKMISNKEFRYEGCGHIEKFDLRNLPAGVYTIHATLTPDQEIAPGIRPIRNSGFRVVKMNK
jgi:Secretion system C-terminal sorting domain